MTEEDQPNAEPTSQQFLRATLDALPSHIAVIDADGKIVTINRAWQKFAVENGGDPSSTGLGTNYIKLCQESKGLGSEDAHVVARGLVDVLACRLPDFAVEYPCHSPKRECWFRVHISPVELGGKTYAVVVHENTTERKTVDLQIAQVLASARCVLWQAYVQDFDGNLIWELEIRNLDAAQKLLPVFIPPGGDFALGMNLATLPKDLEAMHACSRTAILSGQEKYQQEFQIRLASGETRFLFEDAKIESLGAGKWTVTGVCTDVSEFKKIERDLRASELLFSRAFDSTPIGMALVSLDGKCIRANQRLCELVGYESSELEGKYITDLTHPDDVARDHENFPRLFRGEIQAYRAEKRYCHKDGHILWVLLGASLIRDDSNMPLMTVAQMQDITAIKSAEAVLLDAKEILEAKVAERTAELVASNSEMVKAVEAAEIANLQKSNFLSRMSHELRTPMNSILGFGQVLESQVLTPMQAEMVGYILKAGKHLLGLINDVLDVSRVEAGTLEISLEAVDLAIVFGDVCSLMQLLANDRNILLAFRIPDSQVRHVRADRQRLRQVLINLLSNAIKYNHDGGSVELTAVPLSDGRIRISVRDWGPGIPQEELPKLFTPFERLQASNSNIEGTGLGLALSQQLVKAMQGRLEVESSAGQGCTFWFDLDSARDPLESAVAIDGLGLVTKPEGDLPIHTVLCIEDNVSNLRLLELIFESRPDVKMISAVQASIGIEMALLHKPNVVLLDLNLPDLSGREVLDYLRQQPTTKDIPVIVVSADATPNQIQKLLAAGATAYLTKPLNVYELLNALDKLFAEAISDMKVNL